MPDYRVMFDNKWVKAWDLDGKPRTLTIERVEAGMIENKKAGKKDKMPILWFKGAKKPFGVNRTNAKTIAAIYGNKTEEWIGKTITLFPTKTTFGSEEMDCIRVKPEKPTAPGGDLPNRAEPIEEPAAAAGAA